MPRPPLPTEVDAMNLLQVEGISKSFGGLQALESVTMDAREGMITALIGPNGAGKTTLLNVINGLLRSDAGSVRLAGEEITHLPAHEIDIQVGIGVPLFRRLIGLNLGGEIVICGDDLEAHLRAE